MVKDNEMNVNAEATNVKRLSKPEGFLEGLSPCLLIPLMS